MTEYAKNMFTFRLNFEKEEEVVTDQTSPEWIIDELLNQAIAERDGLVGKVRVLNGRIAGLTKVLVETFDWKGLYVADDAEARISPCKVPSVSLEAVSEALAEYNRMLDQPGRDEWVDADAGQALAGELARIIKGEEDERCQQHER